MQVFVVCRLKKFFCKDREKEMKYLLECRKKVITCVSFGVCFRHIQNFPLAGFDKIHKQYGKFGNFMSESKYCRYLRKISLHGKALFR